MHYAIGNKYPIETPEQVKIAEDYFTKYFTRLEPADRVIVATNLEKRAEELGMETEEDWIINYSRMTKEARQVSPTFEANLVMRKEALQEKADDLITIDGKQVRAGDALMKIAEMKVAGAHGDVLVQTIEEFDKTAGIEYAYDNKIVDPVMTVYGNLANPKFDAVKIAGDLTDYDIKRKANDPEVLEKIAEQFGKEAAQRFHQIPLTATLEYRDPELSVLTNILEG